MITNGNDIKELNNAQQLPSLNTYIKLTETTHWQWNQPFYIIDILLGGLSLKIKNLNIHLYSIATKYLWNNALVEHIDN